MNDIVYNSKKDLIIWLIIGISLILITVSAYYLDKKDNRCITDYNYFCHYKGMITIYNGEKGYSFVSCEKNGQVFQFTIDEYNKYCKIS